MEASFAGSSHSASGKQSKGPTDFTKNIASRFADLELDHAEEFAVEICEDQRAGDDRHLCAGLHLRGVAGETGPAFDDAVEALTLSKCLLEAEFSASPSNATN